MHYHTLAQHVRNLQQKKYSCVELVDFYCKRIAKYAAKLNCFITIIPPEKLYEQAKNIDHKLAKGIAGSIAGIPIAHKDIMCTRGVKTTCASKILENFISPYNATLVDRLGFQGAIMVGKTNMDEFAMGSSNENSYFGPVHNPWNLECVPGGSSGGSAAAVAARLVVGATATDTGGSIRQPASLSGITGIKPTYGLVSRFGVVAFASSLDHPGVLAQTAEDCALLLQHMAGYDPLDSTSANKPVPNYAAALQKLPKGLKIGIAKEFLPDTLDPNILAAFQQTVNVLEKAGMKIKNISLPNMHLSIPAYYIIAPAECSSNLARYDGVRYGYRCSNAKSLDDMYKRSRSEGFGNEVKRRILIGTYVLSAGYFDAFYLKATKIRAIIADDFKRALQEVDVILTPTVPNTAFKINEKSADPISMYLQDIYTVAVNLAGLPALSMPIGFSNNLPIGGQIIGNYFQEDLILNLAHYFQSITDWHNKVPELVKD